MKNCTETKEGAFASLASARTIFLTGATGFLGAHILRELLNYPHLEIVCLVRAKDENAALARIKQNLEFHCGQINTVLDGVRAVVGDVTKPRLGLSEEIWSELAAKLDIIFHGAAWMGWLDPFNKLEPVNVGGTKRIIELAQTGKKKTLHHVSTTGVYMSLDADKLGYLNKSEPLENYSRHVVGYLKSKWQGELLVQKALKSGLAGTIHRPSFILGTASSGYIPEDDLTRLFLTACLEVGAVPDLNYFIDVVPVDLVARAITNIATKPDRNGRAFNLSFPLKFSLRDFAPLTAGSVASFNLVPFDDWRSRLRILPMTNAKKVMSLFCWPVPGAPDGLMSHYSKVTLDPSNVDITEALEGSGRVFPDFTSDFLGMYLSNILANGDDGRHKLSS